MSHQISKCALCGEIAQWEAQDNCDYPYQVFCTNLECGNGTSPFSNVLLAIYFWNNMQVIIEKGLRFDEYKAIVDASGGHSKGGRL